MTEEADLIVVGAGVAGLAAAKAARAAGAAVRVLEAGPRTGGRAHTRTTASGHPWDAGAHWLHHAERNPFTAEADRQGAVYAKTIGGFEIHGDAGFVGEAEKTDWTAWSDAAFAAAATPGEAGRDVAASEAIPRHARWRPLFDGWFGAMSGVLPEQHSALDYARSAESDNNWPLREGYGALVAAWAAEVPVELETPVTAIDTRGPLVAVETPRGTLRARAVVVALPLGVLQRERVRFTPALPAAVGEALHGLHPGQANKVAVELDPAVLADVAPTSYLSFLETRETMRFQLKPFGRPMTVGYLAGPVAADLEAEGPEAMVAFARERLQRAFGSRAVAQMETAQTTSWLHHPLSLGAYSCALPGHADARTLLQEPVSERLALAGEYAHTTLYGCVDGARASGERAVAQLLPALGLSAARGQPASAPTA
jgi:monoamine oxidase